MSIKAVIIFLQQPSSATFLALCSQMSFCYRKQRGWEGAQGKGGEGECGEEAGRMIVEITLNSKLEMDSDWPL